MKRWGRAVAGEGEKAAGLLVDAGQLALAHRVALWCVVSMSLFMVFWGPEFTPLQAVLLLMLAAGALLLAQALAPLLLDLFAGLGYRERFLILIAHMALFLSPKLFGVGSWEACYAGLLLFLCLQAVSPVHYGRLLLLAGAGVMGKAIFFPGLPLVLPSAFALAVLAALRLEFLTTRLEAFDPEARVLLHVLLRESLFPVMLPWGGATVLLLLLAWLWRGKNALFSLSTPQARAVAGAPGSNWTLSGIVLDAAILVLMLSAFLALLIWLEKQLKRLSRGKKLEGDEPLAMAERVEAAPAPRTEELLPREESDPRGRVIASLHGFSEMLALRGLGRQEGESAREYLDRVARSESVAEEAIEAIFDRSCYASESEVITEEEAERFTQGLARLREQIESEATTGGVSPTTSI